MNKPSHQQETNDQVKYHCMDSCNACGDVNEIIETWMIESHVVEAKTKCKKCGHDDQWAHGFFESSQEMESKCQTYSFDF